MSHNVLFNVGVMINANPVSAEKAMVTAEYKTGTKPNPPKQKSLDPSVYNPQYCNSLLMIMKCFELDNICASTDYWRERMEGRESREYSIMDERMIAQY